MTEIRQILRIFPDRRLDGLVDQLNRVLVQITDRLDQMEGHRGTPKFWADVDLNDNKLENVEAATVDSDAPNWGQIPKTAADLPFDPTDTNPADDVQEAIENIVGDNLVSWTWTHNWESTYVESQVSPIVGLSAREVQPALEEIVGHTGVYNGYGDWTWTHNWEQGYVFQSVTPAGGMTARTIQAALEYFEDAITQVIYNPDVVTTNTGNLTGGDVNSLDTMGDGDTYDADEVTGVPGFDIECGFSGVVSFSKIWIGAGYDGSVSHINDVKLYNYDTTSYDNFDVIPNTSGVITFYEATVPFSASYVDGSGNANLKIYHTTTGTPSHDIAVDYVALVKLGAGASVTYDSAWDGTHLELGTYHIWVDEDGNLRILNAAPSAHDDGVAVGSQTDIT